MQRVLNSTLTYGSVSAAPTAQNSPPELHFCFMNYLIQPSLVGSLTEKNGYNLTYPTTCTTYIFSNLLLGNVSSMESESALQLSKMKLMSKEFDMGLTLAGISLMFVLCQSIKLVVDIYELMVCDHFKIAKEGYDPKCHNPIKIDIIASFGNLFVCINSAANFLLYMVKGEKFRDAFCQTYFSCKSSNILPNHSTNLTMTSRTNSISIRKNYSTKNEIN